MMLIGSTCPDVSASAYFNGEIKSFTFNELKRPWKLIYFYPGDFTFVCPTELTELAANDCEFDNLNVDVVVISVDSPYVHKAWDDVELSKMIGRKYPFPMLSDQGGRIGQSFGVYDEKAKVDIRGSFIIDPDNIVQGATILSAPVGRNVKEIIRQIKAFQYVRENNAVCPASWQPGDKALIPGADLVGSVYNYWKMSTISDEGA